MKKKLFFMAMAVIVLVFMTLPADGKAQITPNRPPAKTNFGSIKWEKKLGAGYHMAPTPPVVAGDYVYTYGNHTVYEYSRNDGTISRKWTIHRGTPGYATLPLTVSDDRKELYGVAYNSEENLSWIFKITLEKNSNDSDAVLYSEKYSGQNICPVVYKNGYVYSGTLETTKDDGDITDAGSYFCVDTKTTDHNVMETVWDYKDTTLDNTGFLIGNGGYYWSGAYVTDDNSCAVFGSDNGSIYVAKQNRQAGSKKNSGNRTVSKAFQCDSSIRSTIVGDTQGYVYVLSRGSLSEKTGKESLQSTLYKLKLTAAGGLDEIAEIRLAGAAVGIPIIQDSKAYVAYEDGVASFDISGNRLAEIDKTSTPGWMKGHLLYSTSNKCLYGQMYEGAGIYYVQVDETGHFVKKGNLYTTNHLTPPPQNGPIYAGYAIDCDQDGNLYCKNDECYFLCIKAGYDTTAPSLTSAKSVDYKSAEITWKKQQNIVSYRLQRSDGKKFILPAGTTSYTDKSLVTGKSYSYWLQGLCGEWTYTNASSKKYVKTIPATPKLSVRAAKKKALMTWSKAGGVKMYQVYRATKKKGRYKLVKSTKNRKWVNKGLKKRKMYYFKVRGYTAVQGQKTYGKWSQVRSCRVR